MKAKNNNPNYNSRPNLLSRAGEAITGGPPSGNMKPFDLRV